MIALDPVTMSAVTALVVVVCGVLYLVDALMRPGNAAARIWAVSFVGGILTTLSYLLWTAVEGGWVAAAVGNAALVGTTGMLWLGCRRFNGPLGRLPGFLVTGTVMVTLVATLVEGPDGGPWAGAWAMFVSLAVLAGLGCAETLRGRLAGFAPALWLRVALGVVSAFYVVRTVVYLLGGPDGEVFVEWLGTQSASVLTIVMTVTAVVAMVVLRVQVEAEREAGPSTQLALKDDGYLDVRSFGLVLSTVVERARALGQPVAVVVVRVEGLQEIAAAFGSRHARDLATRWRAVTLRNAPLTAFLANDTGRAVFVGAPCTSDAEALTLASRLSQQLMEELTGTEVEILPVIGVGVATGAMVRDAADLMALADAAAVRSAQNLDAAPVLDAPLPGVEGGVSAR